MLSVLNLFPLSPLRLLPYSLLLKELKLSSVRELEDLIIEGGSANVVQGKLDQKGSHFEVDYIMARDIKKVKRGRLQPATIFIYFCRSTF